jgi:hypothetical protein
MWGKSSSVTRSKLATIIKDGCRGNLAKLRRRSAVDGFRGGSAGVAYDGSLTYPRAPVAVTNCFHVE